MKPPSSWVTLETTLPASKNRAAPASSAPGRCRWRPAGRHGRAAVPAVSQHRPVGGDRQRMADVRGTARKVVQQPTEITRVGHRNGPLWLFFVARVGRSGVGRGEVEGVGWSRAGRARIPVLHPGVTGVGPRVWARRARSTHRAGRPATPGHTAGVGGHRGGDLARVAARCRWNGPPATARRPGTRCRWGARDRQASARSPS